MNQIVRGVFNGTGAVVNVGLGFVPSYVKVWNITEATQLYAIGEWQQEMVKALKTNEGLQLSVADDTDADAADLTVAGGFKPYLGGDVADNTETYIGKDRSPDKRGSGAGDAITTWTLGHSTNRTGNWNAVCCLTVPSQVGVGSEIVINSGAGNKQYRIQAITSNGEAANEVTLDIAAPTGRIVFLGGIHTFVQVPTSIITEAGFTLAADANINANDEIMVFEAGH